MRVAPIGLVQEWSAQEAFEAAARAAAVTHSHPSGYWSAAAMAAMTRLLVYGMELPDAAKSAQEMLVPRRGSGETIDSINAALKAALSGHKHHPLAIRRLGLGWVGEEALGIALPIEGKEVVVVKLQLQPNPAEPV